MEKLAFSEFGLNKQLLQAIDACGWTAATPVQRAVIPKVLSGQHVVGIAHTGTGKTAAYLIPLLRMLGYAQGQEPRCMVIVPVHELAVQVSGHARQLAAHTSLRIGALYGGSSIKKQREELASGLDLIIGTPGRIQELYRENSLSVRKIKHLVLDEADKLLDMGFMPQLNRLFEILPVKRQNLLFTATMSEKVKKLVEQFIDFPLYIEIGQETRTAPGVEQQLYAVPNFDTKMIFLKKLLTEDESMKKVMVFCRSKSIARKISDSLKEIIPAEQVRRIDGNQQQQQRLNAVQALNSGEARVLVATDIAARGLDIKSVTHVINFDVPLVYDDYVHRIGRTARVFSTGKSITFCTDSDRWHWNKIEALIGMKMPFCPLPENIQPLPTPFEEQQYMNRQMDAQRKKDNPEFMGAFHNKKSSKNKKRKPAQ